jgi:hypothetical protein
LKITETILQEAIKLVIEDKKTLLETANLLGCSKGGLVKALLKNQVYRNYSNQDRFSNCLLDIEIINSRHQLGTPIKTIAKEYNVQAKYLIKLLKEKGYKVNQYKKFLDKDIINEAQILVNQGYTLEYIKDELGHSSEAISRNLKARGVNLERGLGSFNYCITDLGLKKLLEEYTYPELTKRNYSFCRGKVKYNPFLNLNSDAVQYWLGYLAADGCISDNGSITACSIDKILIENICSFINRNINVCTNTPKIGRTQYSFSFSNKEVANYLSDLGLTPRKTLNIKMNIPLTFPFIRGLIDGDGSIKIKSKNSIVVSIASASLEFANQIVEFLTSNGITCKLSKEKIYIIRMASINNVYNLYRYLYYNASFYLQRKKDRYNCILEKLNHIE